MCARGFLVGSVVAATLLSQGGAAKATAASTRSGSLGTLQQLPDLLTHASLFTDPPMAARPKFRWWWTNSDASLNAAELRREVDAMYAAGFGGAEIAFNNGGASGGWATPAQRSALQAVVEEAGKLGFKIDMTFGASWPITTPATAPATGLSEHELVYGRIDLTGPVPYSGPVPPPADDPANSKGATLLAVTGGHVLTEGQPAPPPPPSAPNTIRPIAAPLASTVLDAASLVDLTSSVSGSGSVSWSVPSAGHWVLFGVWQRPASQNVMDHFSAAAANAVTRYLDANQLGSSVSALLPGTGRDFFEDSLELAANLLWTPAMSREFRALRGYDVAKYLPLLFVAGETTYPVPQTRPPADFDLPGSAGDRVRHDYYETLMDLYVRDHIDVFIQWARTHGMNYRTQPAYGAPLDLTRSGREVDTAGGIADEESLNAGDPARSTADTNWRFAMDHFRTLVGGVHQGGGLEVDDELGAVFFRDQELGLAEYKSIMDKEWAAGITRPIVHGFAYNPPGSAWPGHDNFSGIVAQSWNQDSYPQFAMWRPLADYWARGNEMLQQGRPQIDVAVYQDRFVTTAATYQGLATSLINNQIGATLPVNAFVTPQGGVIDTTVPGFRPTPFFDGQPLEEAGYTFEYIDPAGLLDPRASSSAVLYPDGPSYRALVVDQRALPGATAQAIARDAEHGLAVVLVGSPPDHGTSNAAAAAEDAQVRDAVMRITRAPLTRTVPTQADVRAALAAMGVIPAAHWSQPTPVYTQHRRTAGTDYWYLWNAASTPVAITGSFATSGTPSRMDLWTGAIEPMAVFAEAAGRVSVPLTLQPGQTAVIAFDRRPSAGVHAVSTTAQEVVSRGSVDEVNDTRSGAHDVVFSDGSKQTVTAPDLPAPVSPSLWQLHVDEVGPGGSTPYDMDLTTLGDWRSISPIAKASGTGTYTTNVTLPPGWTSPGRGTYLDLGTADGALQLYVNGSRAAPRVTAQAPFDIGSLLHSGVNQLRVVLTTTLKNRIVGLAQGGDTDLAIYLAQPATQPYGLIGPVRLIPYASASVAVPGHSAAALTPAGGSPNTSTGVVGTLVPQVSGAAAILGLLAVSRRRRRRAGA